MKFLLLLITLCITSTLFSQIDEWLGVDAFEECSFEDDCSRIEMDTSLTNIWQIGVPNKVVFDTSYSPTNCIVTDTVLTYPNSNLSFFDFTVYAFEGGFMDNTIVGFKHKVNSDTLIDGGYLEFRYDPEGIWRNVIDHQLLHPEVTFETENLYGESDTLIDGTNGFSGTTDWVHTRIQWVWYYALRESFDTLYLRFNFMSDTNDTGKDGWMIDDLTVSHVLIPGSLDENILGQSRLDVFPNPSMGLTAIKYEDHKNEKYKLKVINMMGQSVIQMDGLSGSTVSLGTRKLPKGIYEVQVHQDGNIKAREKLIVQ